MSFSDGIESAWGSFRTTLFFLGGWLVCLIASILFSTVFAYHGADGKVTLAIPMIIQPGLLFDYAILFAFATYYPKFELRLFFVLPVPIAIIAIISGGVVLLSAMIGLPFLIYSVLCLSHYLVIAIPLLINRGKREAHKVKHKAKNKKAAYFHKCTQCGATDTQNESLIFRVREDGSEICENCRNQ